MKQKRASAGVWVFFILSVIIHIFFLYSIARHFDIKTANGSFKIAPVKIPGNEQKHRGVVPEECLRTPGVFRYFEEKFWEEKRKTALGKFMSIPPRKTTNQLMDLLVRDANNTDPGGDFYQIWRAGRDLRYNLSLFQNYNERDSKRAIEELNAVDPFHPPNRYLPAMIYLFGLPLSYLGPYHAYIVWTVFHELVLALCLIIVWKIASKTSVRLTVAGMWLMFAPYYLEMYMGQTSFLIAACIMLTAYGIMKNRNRLLTGAWTLSLLVKPLTLLFVPLFVRLKKWKTILTGITVSALLAVPYFLARPDDFRLFVSWAFGQELVTNIGNLCFQNLLNHFFFSDAVLRVAVALIMLSALAATFYPRKIDLIDNLCLWITAYFITYAHVWEHHLVVALPLFGLLYWKACEGIDVNSGDATDRADNEQPEAKLRKAPSVPRSVVMLCWALAAAPSVYYLYTGTGSWIREIIYLSQKSVPIIILYLWLLILHFRKGRSIPQNDVIS